MPAFLAAPMSPLIRPMLPSDLDALLRVQAACYPPAMQEAAAVVAGRLQSASGTCAVACDPDGVCGYLFAYPSRLGRVTDLGAPFAIAPGADTLYLHDLAVDPRALGRGLARTLVAHVLGLGRDLGLAHSALVSVQDSARFWEALGYRCIATDAPGLLTYAADARYMVRSPV